MEQGDRGRGGCEHFLSKINVHMFPQRQWPRQQVIPAQKDIWHHQMTFEVEPASVRRPVLDN